MRVAAEPDRSVSYATGPALRPGEPGAVIRAARGGGWELVNLVWGFAPREPGGQPITYVRAEGRSFDGNGSGGGRCLIPASEFTVSSGRGARRRKWRATLAVTNDLFYFAGLWRPVERGWPPSYALITIPAGPDIAPIQARQAAVIRREDRMGWLEHWEPEGKLLAPLARGSFWLERVEEAPARSGGERRMCGG